MTIFRGLVLAVAFLLPLSAAAQTSSSKMWMLSPHIGATTGGDTTKPATTVGVTAGWMGAGWLGAEADLGWTPTFFAQDGFLTERRVVTLMGNGVVRVPWGHSDASSPYVSGGLGLFRPKLSEPGALFVIDTNKLGWNLGGGVMAGGASVGVRGDVRYFRSTGKKDDANAFGIDPAKFGFWRLTTGLVVKF
jgi:hypothetical protein